MMNLFKKKEERSDMPPVFESDVKKQIEAAIPDIPKIDELPSDFKPAWENKTLVKKAMSYPTTNVEGLVKKIDNDVESVEDKVNKIRHSVSKLELNSPEITDLLNIYSKTKSKIETHVNEIDRFDSVGWNMENNLAAFYKFRACKGLSEMKKQMSEIEKMFEEAGFTASKIEDIMKTPASQLVDQLTEKSRKKR